MVEQVQYLYLVNFFFMITLADMEIISYCQAVQELLDSERFLKGFSDNVLLRFKIPEIETELKNLKNDILIKNRQKYFLGIKAIIIDFLDRIIALTNSRFSNIDLAKVKEIESNAKKLMKNILYANDFEDLKAYKDFFKKNIYLNIYELFIQKNKGKL